MGPFASFAERKVATAIQKYIVTARMVEHFFDSIHDIT
jgi:hypothetical protein